jgi:lipid II:glycine glycyltransferase (peptidoglycan interpeptide bridge formation enzyme)
MATAPATDAAAITEIDDRHEWDSLATSLGAQPFQAWAWGALKQDFGWQPHRFATSDRTAAAQVLVRPFSGLSVAYAPRGPFPVTAEGTLDESLLDHVIGLARRRRAAFLRFEPDLLITDPRAPALDEFLRARGFRTSEKTLGQRSSIRLDLTRTEDEIFASFSKGHRADTKRAMRDGVTVRRATDEADVDWLHRMLGATTERKSFEFHSAAYYRALWRHFGDAASLLLAEWQGEVVAATLNIAWAGNGLYLFAGSTRAGLQSRAGHLLQWESIRWAKARGATSWDLWGIADARGRMELLRYEGVADDSAQMIALDEEARRDPKDGLERFKKGWGGHAVRVVPAYDKVFIPPAYWFWTRRRGEG